MKSVLRKILTYSLLLLLLLGIMLSGFFVGKTKEEVEIVEEDIEYAEQIPYQALFEQYAPMLDWDWQLLAALCYTESRFNASAHSASGAKGLMQLMPKTAKRFSLNDSTIYVPEDNIKAGVQYIGFLKRKFDFIQNRKEQQRFVLATYNSGPAHIMDARRLAKKHGASAYIWYGQTEYWLEQLSNPEYASDTTCVLYGSFNAAETVAHVKKVERTYEKFKQLTEREPK